MSMPAKKYMKELWTSQKKLKAALEKDTARSYIPYKAASRESQLQARFLEMVFDIVLQKLIWASLERKRTYPKLRRGVRSILKQ